MDINKTRTTGYHPSGNGTVERFNKTLCSMLATFVSENQRDWDLVVPKVVFAYNTSKHETTGVTPFELFHGRSARLPLDVTCGGSDCPADRICSPRELDEIRRKVTDAIAEAAEKRRQRQVVHQVQHRVGDRVWLHRAVGRRGLSPKLQNPWSGPFEIIEVLSPQNYRLRLKNGKTTVVHHDHLKPFVERPDSECKVSHGDAGSQGEAVDTGEVPAVDVGEVPDDDNVTYLFKYRSPDVCITQNTDAVGSSGCTVVVSPTVTEASDGGFAWASGCAEVSHGADGVTEPYVDPGVCDDAAATEGETLALPEGVGAGMTVVRRSKRKRSAPKLYGEWAFD